MTRRRIRLALALASAGAALAAGELLLQLRWPQPTYRRMAAQVVSLWRPGDDLPFSLAPGARIGVRDMGGEFGAEVSTNSLGYRDDEFAIDKPAGTFRVLVLGDSQTFGYGVADRDTYPQLLERELGAGARRVEVINAGYASGYSPDGYYVYLKHRGLALSPDVVVLTYFVYNDFTDLLENQWTAVDGTGLPERIRSRHRWINEDGVRMSRSTRLRYRIPVLRSSHLFILAARGVGDRLLPAPAPDRENWHFDFGMFREQPGPELRVAMDRSIELVAASERLAAGRSIRFLVVLLPADLQLYPGEAWKYTRGAAIEPPPDVLESEWPQRHLRQGLEARSIAVLDLLGEFRANRRTRIYFRNDPHLNPLGHRVVAQYLARELAERGWLPAPR